MRLRDLFSWSGRERAAPTAAVAGASASQPPGFDTMHSADLDVHLAGVTRPPRTAPPWGQVTWSRHDAAHRRAPSALARAILELHPAFVVDREDGDRGTSGAHWTSVDQAEALAMEWTAAGFTPGEAAGWLAGHHGITPQRARDLALRGLGPKDPIDLRVYGRTRAESA